MNTRVALVAASFLSVLGACSGAGGRPSEPAVRCDNPRAIQAAQFAMWREVSEVVAAADAGCQELASGLTKWLDMYEEAFRNIHRTAGRCGIEPAPETEQLALRFALNTHYCAGWDPARRAARRVEDASNAGGDLR